MNILETFLLGKENNLNTCEDGLFISDYLIAVIDGVTAKGTYLWNGKKSGCFAKDVLLETLKEMVENPNSKQLLKQDIIILASDGYSELGDSLEESEALLKEILVEDPLCFRRNRSTKGVKKENISFDDRVFCKIQI